MERSILFKTMVVATLALPTMMGSCKKDEKADAPAKPAVKVESLTLNIHDTTIFAGDNFMLTATVLPANAVQDVEWSSLDDTIASVLSTGKVYSDQNAGSTYIFATSKDGIHKDSCKVTVIKNIDFKDAKLLNVLKNNTSINTDGDDGISRKEAELVKSLKIADKGITSFDEIYYFYNVEELFCDDNNLTKLDLSKLKNLKKLYCSNNQLAKLDISQNTALTTLICNKNSIDTLDIRGNNNLTDLFCGNQANGNLKLELTIDQFNSVWKENGTDSDNQNVDMVMNFFEGATIKSSKLDKELKDGDSTSFKASKGEFTFRLFDSENNELSFYDPSVLRQIVWTSSNESVATISAEYEDAENANTAIMTVTAVAAGNTVIKGTVNDEYTISFNLEVK
ncbi:MAG: Ig-like domain-containing protein [Paludibacteraceae bacterium]|nr:Ig-like domain-containing protein [Paludibacteraceae bacterium]